MLVLSRKLGETIVIGQDIRVTVTRIAGGRVTLGIQADPSIKVMRAELILPPEPQKENDAEAA